MTIKRIVILSDLQVPFEDVHVTRNISKFLATFKPDQTVTIGDEIDFNTISKFSDGTPEAYQQTLGDDRDRCVDLLWDLGVTDCIRSNHTDRLYNIIMKKIPSFLSLPELRFEKFMKFDELGITFHKKPMQLARNERDGSSSQDGSKHRLRAHASRWQDIVLRSHRRPYGARSPWG